MLRGRTARTVAARAARRDATSGCPGQNASVEEIVDVVVRRVLALRDLLQDRPCARGRSPRSAKRECRKMSPSRSSASGRCSREHLRVVAGVLLAGERVEHAADRVDLLGDLRRRPPLGALEEQVLEEVRDARLLARLVARAVLHPDADRDRRAGRPAPRRATRMPFGKRGGAHAVSCAASCARGLAQRLLAREADLARLVDLEHLDVDHVALLEHVGHLLHALVGDLRDVQQAVGARHDLDERAEVDDLAHRALVDLADLGLRREAADDLDRPLHRRRRRPTRRAPCRRPRRRSCSRSPRRCRGWSCRRVR